jgi:hypothetical protein
VATAQPVYAAVPPGGACVNGSIPTNLGCTGPSAVGFGQYYPGYGSTCYGLYYACGFNSYYPNVYAGSVNGCATIYVVSCNGSTSGCFYLFSTCGTQTFNINFNFFNHCGNGGNWNGCNNNNFHGCGWWCMNGNNPCNNACVQPVHPIQPLQPMSNGTAPLTPLQPSNVGVGCLGNCPPPPGH